MADKALLLGINNYAAISDLRGCINDVRNMRDTLVSVFRFAPDSIHTLTDNEVVKTKVQREMDWLLDARPGDRVVFHYSGHGSYIDDRDGDETSDGRDELICLHDMAWEKTDSFLTDDELRAWTKRLPAGVQLLVVMDCCHSGTNTRFLADARSITDPRKVPLVDTKQTQDRALQGMRGPVGAREAAHALEDDRNIVRVRFAPPPAWVVAAVERRRGARAMRAQPPIDPSMNHILLAGCRDDQTSADAYIASDFRGAFTHFLCQSLRQGGATIDRGELIRQVRTSLSREQFAQVPQLEGPRDNGPLFSSGFVPPPPPGPGGGSPGGFPPSPGPSTPPGSSMTDRIRHQIEALSAQVHNLQQQLNNLSAGGMGSILGRGNRHLVYVHGICWHDAGYSDPWWAALKPYAPSLGEGQLGGTRHEVLWSDLVSSSPRAGVRALSASLPDEAHEFREDLRSILEDRVQREVQSQAAARGTRDPAPMAMPRAMFGIPGMDCVDDFMKYLYFDGVRMQVIDRFRQVVAPLLSSGAEVEIISHSWGTVVAYEALRMMESEGLTGRVPVFFTVGSALSIGPIRRRLLPAFRNGAKPGQVGIWVNLDAHGDPVGGSLAQWAAVDREFLELFPVGCTPNWLGAVSPACAHSSYFNAGNLQTNRDIFGQFIEA